MSSLMNVLATAWMARSGFALRASARIGSTGAIKGVTRASSPSIRPTMRTVDPVRRDEPGLGRGVERVGQLLNVVVWTPSSGAPAAVSFATRSPTAA